MAIRNVVQVGDDVLRQKCFPVENFDESLHKLLEDMKDTVKKEEGAGLAAPQVGILRRVVVVDVEDGYFEFINPVILSQKGEQTGWEGCLSVRGKSGIVSRPMKVKLSCGKILLSTLSCAEKVKSFSQNCCSIGMMKFLLP